MPASLLLRVVAIALSSAATLAQTTPQQTTEQQPKKTKSRTLENKVLDLVSPNRLVIEGRNTKLPPLSTAQKFSQVGKNFFNPFTFIGLGIEAGFDQAIDIHHGYGQGAKGYAKRYAADLADTAAVLVRLGSDVEGIRKVQISLGGPTAFHPSVLARMGRFPR